MSPERNKQDFGRNKFSLPLLLQSVLFAVFGVMYSGE